MKPIGKYTKDDILRLVKRGHTFSYDEIVNAIEKELTAKGFTPEKCDWIIRASDDKGVVSCIVVMNEVSDYRAPAFCWNYGIDNTVKFSGVSGYYYHKEESFVPGSRIKKLIKTHKTYEESLVAFLENELLATPFDEDGYGHTSEILNLYLSNVINKEFLEDLKDINIHGTPIYRAYYKALFEKIHPRQFSAKLLTSQEHFSVPGRSYTSVGVKVMDFSDTTTAECPVKSYDVHEKVLPIDEEKIEEETLEEEEEEILEEPICEETPVSKERVKRKPLFFGKKKRKYRKKPTTESVSGDVVTSVTTSSIGDITRKALEEAVISATKSLYDKESYEEKPTTYNPF